MTAAALVVYGVLLAASVVVVFRRPQVALFVFILGLPLHNIVMSLLYGGGVRGRALDAIQAWKEIVLATAVASVAVAAIRARRLPFRPNLVDWLALAYAAIVLLYAVIPQSALDGHAGREGDRLRPAPRPRLRRRLLPRPLAAARRPPRPLGDRGRRGRRRRLGPDRGLRRPDRVVAPLRRGRLLPPRARLRLPRARRPAGELRVQHERRALPPAGLDVRLAARDRVHARGRVAPAGNRPPGAAARDRARRRLRRRPALDVLALVDRRARDRPARRSPPPAAAGGPPAPRSAPSPSASASPRSSTTSRRAPTGSRATCPTRRRRRRRKGRCPTDAGLSGT